MKQLESFPERCRQSVATVSKALRLDYDVAYNAILLAACMHDYAPHQQEVVDEILSRGKDAPCETKRFFQGKRKSAGSR